MASTNYAFYDPFFSSLLTKAEFPEIHRFSVNRRILGHNRRIREIRYLKYPPSDKVSRYGRANMPKQSVFYGTFDMLTAIKEIRPEIGYLVTKSTWICSEGSFLHYCPIFNNWRLDDDTINLEFWEFDSEFKKRLKNYPPLIRKKIEELTKFVADSFTKPVTQNSKFGYFFSAYFANKILYDFSDENGVPVDAILYPSVSQKGAFSNLAIKPSVFDQLYKITEVKDSVVVSAPWVDGKGFFMEGLGNCQDFDLDSGIILWPERNLQPTEKLDQLKRFWGVDLG